MPLLTKYRLSTPMSPSHSFHFEPPSHFPGGMPFVHSGLVSISDHCQSSMFNQFGYMELFSKTTSFPTTLPEELSCLKTESIFNCSSCLYVSQEGLLSNHHAYWWKVYLTIYFSMVLIKQSSTFEINRYLHLSFCSVFHLLCLIAKLKLHSNRQCFTSAARISIGIIPANPCTESSFKRWQFLRNVNYIILPTMVLFTTQGDQFRSE